jgi:hypothetical protein
MDDEEIIHFSNDIVEHKYGRKLISFIRKVCDARDDIILNHESRNRFGTYNTSQNTILRIKVFRHCDVIGISHYSICITLWGIKWNNSIYPYRPFTDYIRNIPYMSPSILQSIQSIQLQNNDIGHLGPTNEYGGKPVIWKDTIHILQSFKQQIQNILNRDSTFHHLSHFNIIQEIQELRLENKELHTKTSMLQTLLKDRVIQDEKYKSDIKQLFHLLKKKDEAAN